MNVVNLWIPALRDRPDDIPVLAEAFLRKHNKRFGKQLWSISDGAIEKLRHYDYPGNARELENLIEQAVSMADREHALTEKMLTMPHYVRRAQTPERPYDVSCPLPDYLAEVEARIIREAIIEAKGNISKAADALQIKRQTLQHKLKKYHISGQ